MAGSRHISARVCFPVRHNQGTEHWQADGQQDAGGKTGPKGKLTFKTKDIKSSDTSSCSSAVTSSIRNMHGLEEIISSRKQTALDLTVATGHSTRAVYMN